MLLVTAAWQQPVPGWTVSKNGPQGFFMGASKGVLRRLPLDPSLIMDYIPVDVVVNAIITTGYYVNALKWVTPPKFISHLTICCYEKYCQTLNSPLKYALNSMFSLDT